MKGVAFTDYYGQQSCTGGHAAFITGQNPVRTGLTKVGLPGADVGLQAEDPTIAELLSLNPLDLRVRNGVIRAVACGCDLCLWVPYLRPEIQCDCHLQRAGTVHTLLPLDAHSPRTMGIRHEGC
jgi:hypothetical protein